MSHRRAPTEMTERRACNSEALGQQAARQPVGNTGRPTSSPPEPAAAPLVLPYMWDLLLDSRGWTAAPAAQWVRISMGKGSHELQPSVKQANVTQHTYGPSGIMHSIPKHQEHAFSLRGEARRAVKCCSASLRAAACPSGLGGMLIKPERRVSWGVMQTIGGCIRDGGSIVDAQVPVEGVEDALQGHPRARGAAQEVVLDGQPGRGGARVDVSLGDVALDLLQRVCLKSASHSIVNQSPLLCKLHDHGMGRLTASVTAALAAAICTAAATFEMQHPDCVQA